MAQDELARIERIYGSVAEYNRVQAEERYEPTEEEIREAELDHKVYSKQIELLDGTPSDLAVKLKEEWNAKAPKPTGSSWTMLDHYNAIEFDKEMKFSVLKTLCDHYGIFMNEKSVFKTVPGSIGISLEYNEHSMIKNINITDIVDYITFQNLYRDIHYIFQWVSLCYCDNEGKTHLVSNTSLGGLRNYYFQSWGLEEKEGIQLELRNKGFDPISYRKTLVNT